MNYKKFTHNYRDSEIEDLFQRAMEIEGLVFHSKDLPIRMDGKKRYVCVSNRSKGKHNTRSGWYKGHLGDFPNGTFGWFHGDQPIFKWSLYTHIKQNNGGKVEYKILTEEQVIENEKQRAREKRRREQEERDQFNFSKALSIIEWERAFELTNHPYMHSKKLTIEECRPYCRILNRNPYTKIEIEELLNNHFPEYNKPHNIRKLINYQVDNIRHRGFNILIRGYLLDNTPQLLQLIFEKKNNAGKNKLFLKELNKFKTLLCIGKQITPDSPPTHVIICEGFATGISIARITQGKVPILIAWDSGNMRAVAIEVRQAYTDVKIYCANDNDHTNLEKNAGVLGGLKVCHAVGAHLITPPFDSNNPDHQSLTDWNDFDDSHEPSESYKIFRSIFANTPYIPAHFESLELLFRHGTTFNPENIFERLFDTPEFFKFWVSAMKLVFNGIQNCNYSYDHCISLLHQEQIKTEETLNNLNLSRIYDPSNELKLIDLIFKFAVKIYNSESFIMLDSEPFNEVFPEIKTIQEQTNTTEPLALLKHIIAHKYGEEISENILIHHLESRNYFGRSTMNWQKTISQNLGEMVAQCVSFPFIVLSKEAELWRIARAEDRVNSVLNTIRNYPISPEIINKALSLQQPTLELACKIQNLFLNPTPENRQAAEDYIKKIELISEESISINLNLLT